MTGREIGIPVCLWYHSLSCGSGQIGRKDSMSVASSWVRAGRVEAS